MFLNLHCERKRSGERGEGREGETHTEESIFPPVCDVCQSRLARPRRRSAHGARDRDAARAFVTTRAGTDTMPGREQEEDGLQEDTSFGAGGPGTFSRAYMRPQTPPPPSAPVDLQAALGPPTSYGTKLFEVVILPTVVNACKPVKDAGDLLILRETLFEELGNTYMWLIYLSVVDWPSLPDADKQQHAQMRL